MNSDKGITVLGDGSSIVEDRPRRRMPSMGTWSSPHQILGIPKIVARSNRIPPFIYRRGLILIQYYKDLDLRVLNQSWIFGTSLWFLIDACVEARCEKKPFPRCRVSPSWRRCLIFSIGPRRILIMEVIKKSLRCHDGGYVRQAPVYPPPTLNRFFTIMGSMETKSRNPIIR